MNLIFPMRPCKRARACVWSLLCFMGVHIVDAQGYSRLIVHHIAPNARHSSIYVRNIIQDPNGYVWIGTEDGLSRYDGKNFTEYSKDPGNRHFISGIDIWCLVLDTVGHLIWEINAFGGIDAIDYVTGNAVFNYCQDKEGATSDLRFTSMVLLGNQLYIGSTNGIFVLDTRKRILQRLKVPVPFNTDKGEIPVDNMVSDRAGNLWIFCPGFGVAVMHIKGNEIVDTLGESRMNVNPTAPIHFFDCTMLQDGSILSASNSGLRVFSLDKTGKIIVNNDPYPAIPPSRNQDIYSCRQDKGGKIWFCVPNYLVRIGGQGKTFDLMRENTSRDEFGWLNTVFNIFFDRNDNLWLGCQQGLAFAQNHASPFFSIYKSPVSETSIKHAYFLNPVNDSLLYCCAQDGLFEVNPGNGVIKALSRKPFFDAFLDPFHNLFASSLEGIFIYVKGKFVPAGKIYPELRNIQKSIINTHCRLGDSLIVFGTLDGHGIRTWDYKNKRAKIIYQNTSDGFLNENTVHTLYKDRQERLWMLGQKSVTIVNFKSHSSRTLDTSFLKKPYSIFFDVCQVKGRYYLASYGAGLLVLDSTLHLIQELSVREGLSSNSVYKIIPYKDSLLFVTSNNGLSVIDVNDHYRIKNYYETDGLHSNNFEESSGAIRNNILYTGGVNGLTVIDPLLFLPHSTPPRLYLRQIKIETDSRLIDTSNLLMRSLEIPNDVRQTTVYFSAINYPNSDRSTFEYRIKELSETWINNGTLDFVPLIGLGPGKYTLLVRAANEDGLWSEPIALTLHFLPKWYQTLWFKLLIIALAGALLYVLYRYRIDQIRAQQQIRKDIASDLHDDIGSTLNTVKIFTHLARRERQNEEHLSHIEASLTEATMGLRDMIWVLDDSQDTIHELTERIKKFAIPVAGANKIRFECLIGEGLGDQAISKTAKRNLLLIAKETINNSIKYARCSHIRVAIRRDNNKLTLAVQDDGQGFDTRNPSQGNGLKNIQQRAFQIHYVAQISSSPGKGTLVEVIEN